MNIFQLFSSILEKISAIYHIDFELRYFSHEKLKIIFFHTKLQIFLYNAQNVLSEFVSSSSHINSKIIISSFALSFTCIIVSIFFLLGNN